VLKYQFLSTITDKERYGRVQKYNKIGYLYFLIEQEIITIINQNSYIKILIQLYKFLKYLVIKKRSLTD